MRNDFPILLKKYISKKKKKKYISKFNTNEILTPLPNINHKIQFPRDCKTIISVFNTTTTAMLSISAEIYKCIFNIKTRLWQLHYRAENTLLNHGNIFEKQEGTALEKLKNFSWPICVIFRLQFCKMYHSLWHTNSTMFKSFLFFLTFKLQVMKI